MRKHKYRRLPRKLKKSACRFSFVDIPGSFTSLGIKFPEGLRLTKYRRKWMYFLRNQIEDSMSFENEILSDLIFNDNERINNISSSL